MRMNYSRVCVAVVLAIGTGCLSSVPSPAQSDMQQQVIGGGGRLSGTSSRAVRPGSNAQGLTMIPEQIAHLKLAPGFLVDLNVLDDSDFSGQFRLDEKGNITIPEIGTIDLAGETASEAREKIAKLLRDRGILRDPQVELNVIEYTAPQVTVLGEVTSPGVFSLLAPDSLENVLAMAGGPTTLAGDQIEITPHGSSKASIDVHYSRQMNADELEHVVVHPGDTVQVKRAGIIYVLGSVNRPGGYIMQEEGKLSVLQAISIAGGTSVTASIGSVYILRKNKDNSVEWLKLPYKKMTHGEASDFQLRVNDMIYMPSSRFKTTFTNTQSVLASAASASIYAAIIY